MKDILILAIESSCDETAASVVRNGREVLSNIISSQIMEHRKFGGVVPEVASRKHVENVSWVVDEALKEAGVKASDLDAVAVTYGPGLVGALLVGLQFAKGFAFSLGKPLIGVNHIEGHIAANYIEHKDLVPPFVSLVVSGGHTFIVHVKDYGDFEVLGETRDDAAGEAFDKVARALSLNYPGGPEIDRVAKLGNPDAIRFPKANFHENTLDFSFSGLKSAVLNYLNSAKQKGIEISVPDVAASFQKAVVSVLTENVIATIKDRKLDKIAIAGGVASNTSLRESLTQAAEKLGAKVLFPSTILCTDNAAMIASAAYFEHISGKESLMSLNAKPGLTLGAR
ncbi:tRNA (adenosine(37)-N6)-threonylcarbamoyltransferase complex transferase subunit TsaD [Youngiibacter multivorans]|uniref:tRNA N6-adenosine threonylcarbamoyltransferase n=1 Tax=Youngiibacter multivorans TaxID=937251 RepID=A0ABS4G3W3_9CLOT|nr:tRNA (adenosine(37)-N6)-threonylcarbamoyltransferase complex transferase subunit TsaD [Youngiibacter multivorans]MBP1919248.1 N6-L-threonylcarbamoyladenine synthase [Youngiibacter multivorans]